jgi:hypothetical protein
VSPTEHPEAIAADEPQSLTVIQPAALEAQERAQTDVMIATAKKFARPKLGAIQDRMIAFATLDEETAEACFYTLKRTAKSGESKLIQGPSIRLAEIALTCYGNIRAASRIIANDGRQVTAQGICHDLENNVLISIEESRAIVSRDGRAFSEDMVVMTGRAISAIARRNAILEVIPRALIQPVYEKAKKKAVGYAKPLEQRRQTVLGRFAQMGIRREEVLRVIEKGSIEEIDADALELLIGLGTAIKDGQLTVDEVFHSGEEQAEQVKVTLREKMRARREARQINAQRGEA